MAYNRAPRGELFGVSQTGPNVAPNSYQVCYDSTCRGKGTSWAPFLVCDDRRKTKSDGPGPSDYFPKINRKVIGGASVLYTAPRFKPVRHLYYDPDLLPKEEEKEVRLKGYMYHCRVPFTLLGYPPTIPNRVHYGYKIKEDRTLVECCDLDHDTTLGPAFYHVNHSTFCNCYRGSFWSKYSRRKLDVVDDNPGVGSYNLQPKPNELEEFLNKVRHERKKHANILRYMDEVQCRAMRNDYPSPAEYTIRQQKCFRQKKKIVPKKIEPPRKVLIRRPRMGTPAPNAYNDPRTAFEYLVKPSCRKGYSAFLTTARRFPKGSAEKRPGPNEYVLQSFVDELGKKVSPYAVRKTAFDTSVPKKLYFLPPDYPIQIECKPCKCSGPLPPPPSMDKYILPPVPDRFKKYVPPYDASCASYNIRKAFEYMKGHCSFRKTKRYDFVFSEKRFARMTNFNVVEDKSYVPGLKYNLLGYPRGKNNSGSFGKSERFFESKAKLPGPMQYCIEKGFSMRTFNVTLGGSTPTPFQTYRMKLKRLAEPRSEQQQQQQQREPPKKGSPCEVQPVNIELLTKEKTKIYLSSA